MTNIDESVAYRYSSLDHTCESSSTEVAEGLVNLEPGFGELRQDVCVKLGITPDQLDREAMIKYKRCSATSAVEIYIARFYAKRVLRVTGATYKQIKSTQQSPVAGLSENVRSAYVGLTAPRDIRMTKDVPVRRFREHEDVWGMGDGSPARR